MKIAAWGSNLCKNFEIICVNCYCLSLSTEWIEKNFKPFARIPERHFDIVIVNIFTATSLKKFLLVLKL